MFKLPVNEKLAAEQRQRAATIPPPQPYHSDYTPTTQQEAEEALCEAHSRAGHTALYAAFVAKSHSNQATIAYAEAIATIARSVAIESLAVASVNPSQARWEWDTISIGNDLFRAEVASAAVSAYHARSPLTAITRWRPWNRNRTFQPAEPWHGLDVIASLVAKAATVCAAAAQTAVADARAATMTTIMPAKGFRAPYDANALPRLHRAGKLARAAAASASAAASALRATHPDLATRTACAATAAVAASTEATITQLIVLSALLPMLSEQVYFVYEFDVPKMLTIFEMVGSDTTHADLFTCYGIQMMSPLIIPHMSNRIAEMLQNGIIEVTATDSSCASDKSEKSTSVTVASASETDDEEQTQGTKRRRLG